MVMNNYGMTLKMKEMRELSELKEDKYKFTLTFDKRTYFRNRHYILAHSHSDSTTLSKYREIAFS